MRVCLFYAHWPSPADLGVADYDGRRALHVAAAEGHQEEATNTLSVCLGLTHSLLALNSFFPSGHEEAIKFLLSQPAVRKWVNAVDRWGQTALNEAVSNDHEGMVGLLKSHGAIVSNSSGYDLCDAAANGNVDALVKLQSCGIELCLGDYDLRTALHLASCANQVQTVSWLLKSGAPKDVRDRYGNTPLDDALRECSKDVIPLLQ